MDAQFLTGMRPRRPVDVGQDSAWAANDAAGRNRLDLVHLGQ